MGVTRPFVVKNKESHVLEKHSHWEREVLRILISYRLNPNEVIGSHHTNCFTLPFGDLFELLLRDRARGHLHELQCLVLHGFAGACAVNHSCLLLYSYVALGVSNVFSSEVLE